MEALAARGRELKQREDALTQQQSAIEEFEAAKKLFAEDPLEAVRKFGGNIDDILLKIATGSQADQGAPAQSPEAQKLQDRLDALEKSIKDREERAAKLAHEEQWAQFRQSQIDKVKAAPDKYEALNALNLQGEVVDIMTSFYERSGGQQISFERAAELAEEKALELARKAQGIKKLQGAAATPATPPTEQGGTSQNGGTLNPGLTEAATPAPANGEVLSREESIARAIAEVSAQQRAS